MTWTPPDLGEVERALKAAGNGRVALDTETCDPDLRAKGPGFRRDAYVIGVSLQVENGSGWYLPVRHQGGDNLDPKKVMALLRRWGKTFHGELVGAHLLYDLEGLALDVTGPVLFPLAVLRDVQCAEPLLDENKPTYALDDLSWTYLGHGKQDLGRLGELAQRAARGTVEANRWAASPQGAFWLLPGREVAAYALGDVTDPLAILRAQEKELAAQELDNVWDLETRLLPVVLDMRLRGVRVDVKRAQRARVGLVTRRAEVLAELKRLAGHEVGLWQPDTFAPVLETAGIRVPQTPKTGRASITKEFLERLNYPPAALYLQGRRIDKAIGTFIDGHVLGSAVHGRVYPSIHSFKNEDGGTVSGRFAYSLPNLQQLSARNEELAPIIRGCFVPEEGEDWYKDDFSQIEYRFLAHYARGRGAEEAREKYRTDPKTSFHRLAAELAHLDADDPPIYKRVKNTNFCKVYGGGYRKIAATANIPEEEAKRFVEEYDKRLPFVKETMNWVSRVAARRGWIKSISGRRHRFVQWEAADWTLSKSMGTFWSREEALSQVNALRQYAREQGDPVPRNGVRRARTYVALNRLLQGGAADAMKRAMVDQWEAGVFDVVKLLVTVHDEEGLSVGKNRRAREAAAEAKRLMEGAVTLSVPLLVERKTGVSWGECE